MEYKRGVSDAAGRLAPEHPVAPERKRTISTIGVVAWRSAGASRFCRPLMATATHCASGSRSSQQCWRYSLSARSATPALRRAAGFLPSTVTGSSPFSHSKSTSLFTRAGSFWIRRPAHRPAGNADRSRSNQSQYDERLSELRPGDFLIHGEGRGQRRVFGIGAGVDAVYRASSDGLRRCRDRCARLQNINHVGAPFAGSVSDMPTSASTRSVATFIAQFRQFAVEIFSRTGRKL